MVSVLPSASLHHFPGIAALVQALVEVRFFGSSVLKISSFVKDRLLYCHFSGRESQALENGSNMQRL